MDVLTSITVRLHVNVDAVGVSATTPSFLTQPALHFQTTTTNHNTPSQTTTPVTITDHAENRPSVTFATDVVAAAVYVNVSRFHAVGATPPNDPLDPAGVKNEARE